MLLFRYFSVALLLLCGVGHLWAEDLKVVLIDSKSGHPLHSKLVCVFFPVTDPIAVNEPRMCRRTDNTGTAAFRLPDTDPQTVKVELASNNLEPCYKSQAFPLGDAMKDGVVAKNTCADETTTTKNPGELVLYGHQKSMKEVLGTARDEW
jgi:hypothetical protein